MIQIQNIKIGDNNPLVLIAGPCVVESESMILETAERLVEITSLAGIELIFKSSYRKANRTSGSSFTGIGDVDALEVLAKVKKDFDIPVLTDIHSPAEAILASEYVDILQIPAFLCRQSDLLKAAGMTGKVINIKKGQFLAPADMVHAAAKIAATGNNNIMLTERGTTFGYHDLVVDMRSLVIMKESGYPVIMDATHAVQQPSASEVSGGNPKFIKPLAKAAAAVGIDGLFLEVHPDPQRAKSDAASQLNINELTDFLYEIKAIDNIIKKQTV